MTNSTVAKKDIQKLQRAIVDGLEDVKAQDIQVFDTEHLSALFERVIIASGTSNRQTKALAGSVRDAVREAGFPKPRVEGETNGEWIIVDCGQAVVHVMQPNFRQYYNLEELWGEKPVRLKFGAAKPSDKELDAPAKSTKKVVEVEGNLRRSNAAKKGVAEAFPSKAQVKKTMAAKSAAKAPAKRAALKKAPAKTTAVVAEKKATVKVVVKKVVINAPVKSAAKKTVAKAPAKVAAKKVPAKAPAKKAAARKA
jgi:ribosome-associated protein